MAIDWASVRVRLEASERHLALAVRPDADAVRAVHKSRMLRLSEQRDRGTSARRSLPMMVCAVCDERYGFSISELLHVGRLAAFTPVWSDRPGVLGVFAWHGEVRTVVCVRSLLGLGGAECRIGDPIVLPRSLQGNAALRVDGLGEIVQVAQDAMVLPAAGNAPKEACVRGRTRDGINVVDLAALARHPALSGYRKAEPWEMQTPN